MVTMQGGVFGAVARLDRLRRSAVSQDCVTGPAAALGHRGASGMTKRFGAFTALDDVSIKVPRRLLPRPARRERRRQEHAGEVPGRLLPARRRRIVVDQRERDIRSPHDAHALGIGMVYQHFTLVPSMTVAENLVMARDDVPAVMRWRQRARAARRVHDAPCRSAFRSTRRSARLAAGREAEGRDPQAALPAAPLHDPRRADLGAHAGRGRRGAGPAEGPDPAQGASPC